MLNAFASASKYDDRNDKELDADDDSDDDDYHAIAMTDNALAARMADMLRRMQQLEVTQAFNTWAESYREIKRCLELVRSAAMMLRIPGMLHVWKTWRSACEASKLAKEKELVLRQLSAGQMGKRRAIAQQ